jgi:hypothetical protein
MKRLHYRLGSLIAVSVLGVFVTVAAAVPGAPATILWDCGQPVGGSGTVDGSGTYTLSCGWSPTVPVTMIVLPVDGGVFASGSASAIGSPWSAGVQGLAPGNYVAVAYMSVTDQVTTQQICSSVATPVVGGCQGVKAAGTITWDKNQPAGGKNVITASATIKLIGDWKVVGKAKAFAFPVKGGFFYSADLSVVGNVIQGAQWNSALAGDYQVVMTVQVESPTSGKSTVSSSVVKVTVTN